MKKCRKLRIGFLAVVLVVAMCFGVTGCKKKFDASAYVKASLDLMTKGDTKDYMKITGETEKEAQKTYQTQIDSAMSTMSVAAGTGMSDEMQTKYEQLFKDMLASAKYKVGEAKETDQGYDVTVSVEKALIAKDVQDKLTKQAADYQKEIVKDLEAGKSMPSNEELYEKIFQMMYDLLNENLQNITYEKAEDITIKVKKGDDEKYTIDNAELQNIATKLYDFDSLQNLAN